MAGAATPPRSALGPNPSAFVQFWLYDHPPVSDRVRFVAEYNPWTGGRETNISVLSDQRRTKSTI